MLTLSEYYIQDVFLQLPFLFVSFSGLLILKALQIQFDELCSPAVHLLPSAESASQPDGPALF